MAGPHRVQAPRQRTGRGARSTVDPPRWRLSGRRLYAVALGGAAVVAAVLIAVSLLGGTGGTTKSATAPIVGKAATAKLLAGIPQNGTILGSPNATYKLVEYADLQCPFCGDFARDVLPALVRTYVRPGTMQIEFRGLDFVGPDSVTALRTALAAAAQNRFWNVTDLIYRNQGTENTGWVTGPFLASVLAAVPGLDASRVLADRDGAAVTARVATAARLAGLDGIQGTPSFRFGLRGGTLVPLAPSAMSASSFEQAMKTALNG